MRIRDAVYVREFGYFGAAQDMSETFDSYDEHAVYIVASSGSGPVGTVKVTEDSAAGLPSDTLADLSTLRGFGRLVEVGHLMTLPGERGRGVGQELMRWALIYSVRKCGASHIVGEFMLRDGKIREFFLDIGFAALTGPVPDMRVKGMPLCQVAALDLLAAARTARTRAGLANERLRYFFRDYDFRDYDEWANGPVTS
jgi:putrescine aminotransferase